MYFEPSTTPYQHLGGFTDWRILFLVGVALIPKPISAQSQGHYPPSSGFQVAIHPPLAFNVLEYHQEEYISQSCHVKDKDRSLFDFSWTGPTGAVVSQTYLLYLPAERVRSGSYTCTARHKQTRKEAHVSFMLIREQREQDFHVSIRVVSEANHLITLECNTGIAVDKLQWFIDDKPSYKAVFLFVHTNDSRNLHRKYECRATYKRITKSAHIEGLLSRDKKHFHVSIDVNPIKPEIHKSFRLQCATDIPSAKVEWFVNNRYSETSPSLNIESPTEIQLQSTYECRVRHNGHVHSDFYRPKTKFLKQHIPFYVTINVTPNNVKLDNSLTLTCKANITSPGLSYRWYVNQTYHSGTPRLEIDRLSREHFHNFYICHVGLNGIFHHATRHVKPKLDVKYGITLTKERGTVYAFRLNERHELHCEFSSMTIPSYSRVKVKWYFQNKLIPKSSQHFTQSDRLQVSVLEIKNTSRYHEGKYECIVNDMRDKKHEANLVLVEDQMRLHIGKSEITVSEGKETEFHCSLINFQGKKSTNPNKVEWFFLGDDPFGTPRNLRPEWNISFEAESVFIDLKKTRKSDEGYYMCRSGSLRIYSLLMVKESCETSSDISISPPNLIVRPHEPFKISCSSTNTFERHQWQYLMINGGYSNYRSVQNDPRFKVIYSSDNLYSTLEVRGLYPTEREVHFTCSVEKKNATSPVFVGENLPYKESCNPTKVNCTKTPDSQLIEAHWMCDGERDCFNNHDESTCYDRTCRYNRPMFTCRNGRSVYKAYLCDNQDDCGDGSDEMGCRKPEIVYSTRSPTLSIRRGKTLQLDCRAMGTPLPEIIWRFNWGCIPDNPARVSISYNASVCNEVHSRLTIVDFQSSDDGIYNCEAINNSGRHMSDDMQAMLLVH